MLSFLLFYTIFSSLKRNGAGDDGDDDDDGDEDEDEDVLMMVSCHVTVVMLPFFAVSLRSVPETKSLLYFGRVLESKNYKLLWLI